MPAKKPKPKGGKSQREKFLETAKDVEAGDSKAAFERAFRKIVPPTAPAINGARGKKGDG